MAHLVELSLDQIATSIQLEGAVADLFDMQDELARRLTDELHLLLQSMAEAPLGLPSAEMVSGSPPVESAPQSSWGTGVGLVEDEGPPSPMLPEVVARDAGGRMTMRATRLSAPLHLDGVLDEGVYREVPPVTDFIQQEPSEETPATDQSEIWVTFDADSVYISARCWSDDPDRIVTNEMKRDDYGMFGNDTISVLLDSFYDRRNAFLFMTNPVGGLLDALVANERMSNLDWNTVGDVATSRFDQGWTVEIAIPFKSLRYRAGPAQVWGIRVGA